MRKASITLVLAAGCALTSRSAPLEIHYYSPEAAAPSPEKTHEAPIARLRLDRVTASANLETRIVSRQSPVEEQTYESLRWTETPDAYVRRSLVRALFEARPLEQVLGGDVPTLDVEVLGFEEVQRRGRPGGRVELRYELYQNRAVLARGDVVEERDAKSARMPDVVVAIGQAMDAATAAVADRVLARLRARPSPAPEGAPGVTAAFGRARRAG
jgi:uncharacterized lipoprotein YmbA